MRLGLVSLDGTKVVANAAAAANRSHAKLTQQVDELEQQVADLLKQAAAADQTDD